MATPATSPGTLAAQKLRLHEQTYELASMKTEETGATVEERRALPHMELIEGNWEAILPADSPTMQVSLKLQKPSYMGMIPPLPKSPSLGLTVMADTGAQMCISPEDKAASLGMKLFIVSTKVLEAT